MGILEKLSPEVLIYIQNIRKYFTTNEETRKYFGINDNEEDFFNIVIEQAQKNFEETGEPELSPNQFEMVKLKIIKSPDMVGVFLHIKGNLGDFGLVSLN